MKRLLLITVLLATAFTTYAQKGFNLVAPSVDPAADSVFFRKMQARMNSVRATAGRPTVAVVLSGGGAKGAAHISALRRLEEKGIPVDMVLGTSMGGLVGGLYALGYSPGFLDTLIRNADWNMLLSDKIDPKYIPYETKMRRARYNLRIPFSFRSFLSGKSGLAPEDDEFKMDDASQSSLAGSLPAGWVSGLNVNNLLARLCTGYRDSVSFADLPIPFCCVASDVVSGKAKNFTSGDIALAMRATMSIPAMFNPVRKDGMILVDGGTRNNFPTDLARAMGADIVIGVVLSQGTPAYSEINNIGDLASQLIDMLSREAYDKNIADADVYIHPDLQGYNMLSFDRESIDSIINRGYEAALKVDSQLDLVASRTGKRSVRSGHTSATDISKVPVHLTGIHFNGVDDNDADYLLGLLDIAPGQDLYNTQIEDAVAKIFATNSFRDVKYSLLKSGGGYDLHFNCTGGPVHRLGVSGRLDTEDMVAALIGIGFNAYNLSGPKFDLEARIGQNWYGQAHFSLTYPRFPAFNISARSGYNRANMVIGDGLYDAGFWHHNADAWLSGYRISHFDVKAGARYDNYRLNSWLTDSGMSITQEQMKVFDTKLYSVYGNARAYTLDDKYYPHKGFSMGFGYRFFFGKDAAQVFQMDYLQHFRLTDRLSLLPNFHARMVVRDDPDGNIFISNFVGGAIAGRYFEQQMPFAGFTRCTIVDDYAYDLTLDLRARLADNLYASVKGGLVQGTTGFSAMFKEFVPDIWGVALELGYDSVAGPLKGSVMWSDITGLGAYLSLGYDF